MAKECATQKKMLNSVFISGAGDLQKNGVKWIVHLRAPDDEADCEKVKVKFLTVYVYNIFLQYSYTYPYLVILIFIYEYVVYE